MGFAPWKRPWRPWKPAPTCWVSISTRPARAIWSRSNARLLSPGCAWQAKHEGCLPDNPDEIIYMWHEDEAHIAELFFGGKGKGILTEDHPAVTRSLYLGRDKHGGAVLCVRQTEKEGIDRKAVAEGLAKMMDAGKLKEIIERAQAGRDEKD